MTERQDPDQEDRRDDAEDPEGDLIRCGIREHPDEEGADGRQHDEGEDEAESAEYQEVASRPGRRSAATPAKGEVANTTAPIGNETLRSTVRESVKLVTSHWSITKCADQAEK